VKVYAPDIAYRGTRSYVHSTDLYEEILTGCEHAGLGTADGPLALRFRRALRVQPDICFLTPGDDRGADAAGEFFLTIAGQQVIGMVRPTRRPMTRHKPYDERPIWERATLSGDTIVLREATGAAPIEVVTALGVLQHRTLYPPAPARRWMLGRIELVRPLIASDAGGVAITLRQQIGGRMTRSSIASDGAALGSMDFLLAEA
jgi:hypothetical protein